jgi:hypothetical protein
MTQAQHTTRGVSDPIITPFVESALADGYKIKKGIDGRCDHLERCSKCQGGYVYTFIKAGIETKRCPHCEQLTPQDRMKNKLSQSGIAYRRIECYGSQVVVTAACRDTADKWAALLANFAKVRGIVETFDDLAADASKSGRRRKIKVYRTFAAI